MRGRERGAVVRGGREGDDERERQRGSEKMMRRGRGGRLLKVSLGVGFFLFILVFFFKMLVWLNRFGSVRFNRFRTLETEPNRNFFVIF